jgi:hypothetical protein
MNSTAIPSLENQKNRAAAMQATTIYTAAAANAEIAQTLDANITPVDPKLKLVHSHLAAQRAAVNVLTQQLPHPQPANVSLNWTFMATQPVELIP